MPDVDAIDVEVIEMRKTNDCAVSLLTASPFNGSCSWWELLLANSMLGTLSGHPVNTYERAGENYVAIPDLSEEIHANSPEWSQARVSSPV